MTWAQVYERIYSRLPQRGQMYGVPRNGLIVAGLLDSKRIVHDVERADLIVDDLIDSGRTRDRYAMTGKPFVALFDKQDGDADLGWIVFPWENEAGPLDAVVRLLQGIGEDPAREGLRGTPHRVVNALREMTAGASEDPATILATTFNENCDEMVVLRSVAFTSLCEHHLLPFTGTADVGYIPSKTGQVVGLSKLARLVECYARRLQVQERMTQQIAEAIRKHLDARGVGVVVRAEHACMGCRGIRKAGAVMVTSSMLGLLREKAEARAEFLQLCR